MWAPWSESSSSRAFDSRWIAPAGPDLAAFEADITPATDTPTTAATTDPDHDDPAGDEHDDPAAAGQETQTAGRFGDIG